MGKHAKPYKNTLVRRTLRKVSSQMITQGVMCDTCSNPRCYRNTFIASVVTRLMNWVK